MPGPRFEDFHQPLGFAAGRARCWSPPGPADTGCRAAVAPHDRGVNTATPHSSARRKAVGKYGRWRPTPQDPAEPRKKGDPALNEAIQERPSGLFLFVRDHQPDRVRRQLGLGAAKKARPVVPSWRISACTVRILRFVPPRPRRGRPSVRRVQWLFARRRPHAGRPKAGRGSAQFVGPGMPEAETKPQGAQLQLATNIHHRGRPGTS